MKRNPQKAHEMVELRRQGLSYRQIGDRFDCSASAVWQAIARSSRWKGYVGHIDDSYRIWIENEAIRTRTNPETVAKALIVDAIEDARNANR